jgi:4-amino-4-deoxy-L-arabinose transferase-like glycosyltransferase
MFRRLDNRVAHHALLLLVGAMLCLPNLGGPSLWDIDEGNNAQAAREMYESGNFVVPTFNYKMRVDKPILLYWLQVAAYHVGGVNELTARLPSALAALLTLLVTYELGRRLFGKPAGLLAGLVLASAIAFCAAAHFANPDALLNLCTVLTLWCFWNHYSRGGWWLLGSAAAAGLGVLAKGPVGLVLPLAVSVLFLLWRRELRRMGDLRVLGASLVFLLVAAPWYVWVGVETKGEWLVGFLWKHNVQRSLGAMENHGGPFFYYGLVLIAGLTPWSVFLGPTAWYALSAIRYPLSAIRNRPEQPSIADSGLRIADCGRQFLLCWLAVWLVFFTVVRTKLPNYILPVYPAVALLTASFLDDWRRGRITLPAWVMPTSLTCLGLTGIAVSVGLLVAGDAIHIEAAHGRYLPGLENGAWLGGVFLAGAAVAGWCIRRGRRDGVIGCTAMVGVVFAAAVAFWGVEVVDRFKAPRALTQAMPEDHTLREVRVAALDYFQPSLVFYCQREVHCPQDDLFALDFLRTPLPVYVFVSAEKWEQLRLFAPATYRLVARHRDLYNGREVLLVTNDRPQ